MLYAEKHISKLLCIVEKLGHCTLSVATEAAFGPRALTTALLFLFNGLFSSM